MTPGARTPPATSPPRTRRTADTDPRALRLALALATAALALLLVLAPSSARALDVWTQPYPGVRVLHRTAPGLDYHVVLVDLSRPEISVVATRPDDRYTSTTEFARRYEAQVAVNANFFGRGSCGLAAGGGEVVEQAFEDACTASMGFGRENEAGVFDSTSVPHGPLPAAWMTEAVSGKPFVLRDGRAVLNWIRPRGLYHGDPRTGVGLSADRKTLVLLAADGRRGVPGMSGFQMARVFREFGASDALNLDGGGSTTLVLDGEVINHPSDRHERPVMSHLGIRFRAGAAWDAAEIVGQGAGERARAGEVVPVWLEARNVGRRTWRPGEGAPVLRFDDGAVSYVAALAHETPPGEVGRFEAAWLARGAGARRLRGRLELPGGGPLVAQELAWRVDVDGPARRGLRPQLAVAVAEAAGADPAADLGAAVSRAGSCAARPAVRGAAGAGLLALGLVASLLRARRKLR